MYGVTQSLCSPTYACWETIKDGCAYLAKKIHAFCCYVFSGQWREAFSNQPSHTTIDCSNKIVRLVKKTIASPTADESPLSALPRKASSQITSNGNSASAAHVGPFTTASHRAAEIIPTKEDRNALNDQGNTQDRCSLFPEPLRFVGSVFFGGTGRTYPFRWSVPCSRRLMAVHREEPRNSRQKHATPLPLINPNYASLLSPRNEEKRFQRNREKTVSALRKKRRTCIKRCIRQASRIKQQCVRLFIDGIFSWVFLVNCASAGLLLSGDYSLEMSRIPSSKMQEIAQSFFILLQLTFTLFVHEQHRQFQRLRKNDPNDEQDFFEFLWTTSLVATKLRASFIPEMLLDSALKTRSLIAFDRSNSSCFLQGLTAINAYLLVCAMYRFYGSLFHKYLPFPDQIAQSCLIKILHFMKKPWTASKYLIYFAPLLMMALPFVYVSFAENLEEAPISLYKKQRSYTAYDLSMLSISLFVSNQIVSSGLQLVRYMRPKDRSNSRR